MRRRAFALKTLVLLSVLFLTASGCLANSSPFRSAAFPTPQAPIFSSAGFQPGLLVSDDSDGEFTLVAFEKMVLEGGNQSDVNIDLSRSPLPVERYLFVIDRSRHSVTVLNADTQDIPQDLGDVHARLTLEVTDPVALAGYTMPDETVFRFAVQYVPGFVRIVDVINQTDAVIELTDLTVGTQSALIQTQLAGLRASVAVDVLDLVQEDDEDMLEESVGPVSRQDKPQQPLNLGDSSVGGSVNIIVSLEDEAPPLAVLPPPTEEIKQPEQDDEPPESDDQPPPELPEPPPDNEGQNDENASGADETPAESEAPSQTATPPPEDPEGEDSIPDSKGGDPNEPNLDVVIVIDDSSNMLIDDPHNERLEAARAYLSAAIEGDLVGIVRFSDDPYKMRMTTIVHKVGTKPSGEIKRLREALDIVPELTTGLTPSHLGLISACDELVENGRVANRIAIIISDGADNSGLDRRGNLAVPLERCFNENGWSIYTVGIGNYVVKNLDALANGTGGIARYVPRDKMEALICEVQAIRSDYGGGTGVSCQSGLAVPTETSHFAVNVPAAQMRASFSLNWLGNGSDIELRLVRPNGKAVAGRAYLPFNDISYDGGANSGKSLETYGIEFPEAGTWRVMVLAKNVPPEGTKFVFGFSSVPAR